MFTIKYLVELSKHQSSQVVNRYQRKPVLSPAKRVPTLKILEYPRNNNDTV